MKTALITLLILTAAMLTASSGAASRSSLIPGFLNAQSGDELREEFRQTYPLSPTGRVSLENLNGAVRINVWDRNEVQVHALKRAYRRERLDEVKIDIRAADDTVRIKTEYPSRNQTFTSEERGRINNPAIVDYTLTVPRQARLESIDLVNGGLQIEGVEGDVRGSSVNGSVTARGLKGEARLSTVNGSLEAAFTQLDEKRAISLNSVNGSVVLVLPSNANAVIRASTVHGAIKNDFGLRVEQGSYVGRDLHGQLGTGGPRVRLGNVNGSITIKHAADGGKVSSVTDLMPEKDTTKAAVEAEVRQQMLQVNREVRQAQLEAARAMRAEQVVARREVERALREAQREIEQAQREVQRATQRSLRDLRRTEVDARVKAEGRSRAFVERESKTFVVKDKPRVNLSTYEGTVKIQGWDKSEVHYTIEKMGHTAEATKAIQVRAVQEGTTVSVIASAHGNHGIVNLEVFVPRSTIVHATSADGSLSVKGVSGELTLRTGDGTIEVADGGGKVTANTGDGRIRITNFDGQVEARTGHGPITLDGKFSGVVARTGDGTISLAIPPDADFTIETNAESVSNEGVTLTEDVAPSKRVKRWKVGRGGNVFTLNTGEGKLIIRPRQQ